MISCCTRAEKRGSTCGRKLEVAGGAEGSVGMSPTLLAVTAVLKARAGDGACEETTRESGTVAGEECSAAVAGGNLEECDPCASLLTWWPGHWGWESRRETPGRVATARPSGTCASSSSSSSITITAWLLDRSLPPWESVKEGLICWPMRAHRS